MKLLFLLLSSAILSLASAQIEAETPALRKAREKAERAWVATVSSRFDLDALLTFLKQTVAEKKVWQGVDLSKPRLELRWTMGGCLMTSGDWSFVALEPKKDDFTFSYLDGDHWMVLKCVREAKKSFKLLEITREKVELITF